VVYDILIYTNISAGFYGCCVQSYRRRQWNGPNNFLQRLW
jgi:hypothetical protein